MTSASYVLVWLHPSAVCVSINKPINEWRKLLFRTILLIFRNHYDLRTYLRFFISLLITDACCVSFLTCSAQLHIGCDILVIAENFIYFRNILCYGKLVYYCSISCSASTAVRARVLLLGGTRWTTNYFHEYTSSLMLLENRAPQ